MVDWSDIGNVLLAAGKPVLGKILTQSFVEEAASNIGSALPIPFGGLIGKMAGGMLANAFDLPETATPDEIKTKMDTLPPAEVNERFTRVEAEAEGKWPALAEIAKAQFAADTEKYKASLLDVQDARAVNMALTKIDSPQSYIPAILATLAILAFTGFVTFLVLKPTLDQSVENILFYVAGALNNLVIMVFSYYFGSSVGSKDKTSALEKLGAAASVTADSAVQASSKIAAKATTPTPPLRR